MSMTPSQTILNALQTLLNEDTVTLGAAAVKHVHLMKAPFTPGPDLSYVSADQNDFTGGAALSAPTGAQLAYRDPISGNLVVQLKEPAGGWHWQATAGTNLPQTVYGVVITDATDAITYGSQLLDNPVLIGAIGDGVDIGILTFVFIPPVLE